MKEDAFYSEETYSKGLSREDTLEGHIRLIKDAYTRMLWHEFEYGVKVLLTLLPTGIRNDFSPLQHDVSTEGVERHYQQFLKIQKSLEDDTNMIWKKKFIKTYE